MITTMLPIPEKLPEITKKCYRDYPGSAYSVYSTHPSSTSELYRLMLAADRDNIINDVTPETMLAWLRELLPGRTMGMNIESIKRRLPLCRNWIAGWKKSEYYDENEHMAGAAIPRPNSMPEKIEGESFMNESDGSNPTNLILYGPPGTGKTYQTMKEAVLLCGGEAPDKDRPKLMEQYKKLVDEKRIRFVTFHQSYAYEDFVEGLRPETGGKPGTVSDGSIDSNNDNEVVSAGFSLTPKDGVFKEIADLAEKERKAEEAKEEERKPNTLQYVLI
ncbi:MAG: hypothetical protein LBV49_09825, partial [Azonexus sp.]|nr:hypothetical protein [Azonexus sp.]